MTFQESILLGIVQGLTEFFPVSSSGHLVLAQHLIKDFNQPGVLFDVILHLGTLSAVLIYFKNEILQTTKGFFSKVKKDRKLGICIILGTIPTGVIALAFKDTFEALFNSTRNVSFMLVLTGIILFASSLIKDAKKQEVSFFDAILIGITQGIAVIPGISRSGMTICTGIFRKINPEKAASFSFILSIPAIVGAVILESRYISSLNNEDIFIYIAGAVAAMITGLISIKFLMMTLKNDRFKYFSIYCFAVGIISFFYF